MLVCLHLWGGQVTTFVDDVVKTFETYSVDVLGVSETGTHTPDNKLTRRAIIRRLGEKGLNCIWGEPLPYKKSLGVLLIYRKGLNVIPLVVEGSSSGRVLAAELVTWDRGLSREVKTMIMVLYGETGMTTKANPPERVNEFNMSVGRIIEDALVEYSGRVMCMGDYNSLADVDMDGMGLVGGVVVANSLVSTMLGLGLIDWFRDLNPDVQAVSYSSPQGSYSRIDYMLGGYGLHGARVCYVPEAEGPVSDHALLLGDVGELFSGVIEMDGERSNVSQLKGWGHVKATDVPWKRFKNLAKPMCEEMPGGGLSEDGVAMKEAFQKIVVAQAEEAGVDPSRLLAELSDSFSKAEAGMVGVGWNYDEWVASGGAAALQASVDSVVPKFLEVVQGSIRSFAGPGDNSEQERREQEAGVIDGLCLVRGSVNRLNRLRHGQQVGRAGSGQRLAKVVKELSGRFKGVEEACDGWEALPDSLSSLLAGGREDVKTMMDAGLEQVPDRSRLEVEADSLWSKESSASFMRKLLAGVAKLRVRRRKEFQEGRFKNYSDGEMGVWFKKSREGEEPIPNSMPVGGGVGAEEAKAVLHREYEHMFAADYESDGPVEGPAGTKYAGRRLGQLKHLLSKRDGKAHLNNVEEMLESMEGDGVRDGDVRAVSAKVLAGLLGHMDQVSEGMDHSVLLGRLSAAERDVVWKGGSKHPGKDGVKRIFMKCFGGDIQEIYVMLVEIGVMFGVEGAKFCEELMFLAPKPTGGYRPLTCQNEVHKAIDEIRAGRIFQAYCKVMRIPAGQVCMG